MNRQEVFDKVRTHLIKQGQASQDTDMCRYRGPNGLKCAIGCLIPDELYVGEMEGMITHNLLREYPAVAGALGGLDEDGGMDMRFLLQLQSIHDSASPARWEERLNLFAKNWELCNG